MMGTMTMPPVAVDVERTVAVTISWEDGHVSTFDLATLRRACPCAACQSDSRAGRHPAVPPELVISDMALAGAWGMTPTWSDGHATGIYSWEYLRDRCPCDACSA
jgi:DUF971 family protein